MNLSLEIIINEIVRLFVTQRNFNVKTQHIPYKAFSHLAGSHQPKPNISQNSCFWLYFSGARPTHTQKPPDYKIISLGPGLLSNPGAKNDSSLSSSQTKSDEELVAIVANNKLASKNKGVFLPLSDETRSRVWQVNEDRKQLINDVCAAKNLRKEVTVNTVKKIKGYTNVAVDDKHKLLYCYVPKVGCTSWKVKLSLMSGNAGDKVLNTHPSPVDTRGGLAKYGIKMLSTYSPEEITYRIDNYFKFMFVRHPMERIVSSYRSKFEKREDNKVEYPWFYSTYGE